MTLMRSLQFHLSLLCLLNHVPKSTSITQNFVYNWCPSTMNFPPNSKYQKNLNTVLESLSSNSTNPDGFHYTFSGNNGTDDAVYGNFLCRGDLTASACSDCVNTATKIDLPQKCPNGKKSIIWYDECIVRYSNKSFYGKMIGIEGPGYTLYDNGNVTRSLRDEFFKVMEKAMKDVADRAANGTSGRKFGTSIKNVVSSLNLYALGQCTPDLTATDCHACLTEATGSLAMSDGARFLLASCNVRYEKYPFFTTSLAPTPAPALPRPPSGGANASGGISNPAATSASRSASCKMTPSHDHLNILMLMGFVMIVWAVNFYHLIIY